MRRPSLSDGLLCPMSGRSTALGTGETKEYDLAATKRSLDARELLGDG